jgi:hypothetical protein
MARTLRIVVQTTTPRRVDDWSIESLALMRRELASIEETGLRFDVVARDRASDSAAPDPVLSTLHESNFDELVRRWISLAGARKQSHSPNPTSERSPDNEHSQS